MTLRPIRNETDYEQALAEIDRLMDVAPHTPESDRSEVLVTLVERYESVHWPMDTDSSHRPGLGGQESQPPETRPRRHRPAEVTSPLRSQGPFA